ncbi:S8 family peptidase [Kibdelosporangium phytohabitans]|uniref:Serine protease n=1 Tax=Kibdelosporangium phytohabitans TaxID=860235 RepID=A0A0N9IGK9_9PSEU|nr:S8 family peptidase [Kibdelosporangium phytohabitans]ALG15649.1 serine protease [Kibdelosporangium phytohabitans]MBE1467209.1 subtilisin family serine protease [Kibdelosporangium phytohabitans]
MGVIRAARITGIAGIAAVAAATVGLAAPASAAQGPILGLDADGVVKDSFVVVLKNADQTTTLGQKYGASVTHTYKSALNGFAATMTEAQARKLAADPAVQYVQANRTLRITDTQPNPPSWGIDRIDQRNLPLDNSYTYSTSASNVSAYIIDTGIRVTHQTFGGRAKPGFDAITSGGNANDCHGHGTHVAGTVGGKEYGVAKAVNLFAVRVLDCNGSGTTAQVVAGIDWVTANAVKPAVANMSLGGGADATLDAAVQKSIASGVTYAIASGNSNANACNYSPARVPEGITVNASTNTDGRASFSNYGTCTDIFAPGQNIVSSWNTNDTATNNISGTSMAAPHVAGGAALYLADNPSASPQQVRDALVNAASDGKITSPGTGSPNKLLFTGSGGTEPPPVTCTTKTNDTDVAIPDLSTVNSPIAISECAGKKGATAGKVAVDITHTYRGDLKIDLVSPSGAVRSLKPASSGDSADNVVETYAVNLSAEDANGTWNLRVQDTARADVGTINKWTLTV